MKVKTTILVILLTFLISFLTTLLFEFEIVQSHWTRQAIIILAIILQFVIGGTMLTTTWRK